MMINELISACLDSIGLMGDDAKITLTMPGKMSYRRKRLIQGNNTSPLGLPITDVPDNKVMVSFKAMEVLQFCYKSMVENNL